MPSAKAILAKGAACASCKVRKVKCSATRPSCDACRRSARFRGDDPAAVVCSYFEGRRCSANGPLGPGSKRVRRAKHSSIEDSDASSTASTESDGSATSPSSSSTSLHTHPARSASPTIERTKRSRDLPTARTRPSGSCFEAYSAGPSRWMTGTETQHELGSFEWSSWSSLAAGPKEQARPTTGEGSSFSQSAGSFAVLSASSLPNSDQGAQSSPSDASTNLSTPDLDGVPSFDEVGFAHIDNLIASVLCPPPIAPNPPLSYIWSDPADSCEQYCPSACTDSAPFPSISGLCDAFLPTAHDYAQTLSLPLLSSPYCI
ncbi:hypothetical protein JCM10908_002291 [Rhodotorula pacifica]|uniref:Zn(II)2Cys6 transcription factor domain-containing protein n=1 Tax=Rhodotorula pacifica TaxID=1495444 RepID=UPI0031772CEC